MTGTTGKSGDDGNERYQEKLDALRYVQSNAVGQSLSPHASIVRAFLQLRHSVAYTLSTKVYLPSMFLKPAKAGDNDSQQRAHPRK